MNAQDQYQPLSQSALLADQSQYYQAQGIAAWDQKVPFQVTNNHFAAFTYAQMVIQFIQDWQNRDGFDPESPFYLLELGTGTGALAYRFIQEFNRLKAELIFMDNITLVHVLSDNAEKNLAFWHAHPQLTPLFKQGVLDSARVNVLDDTPIDLIHSGMRLNTHTLAQPLIVISNYLFDTLPQDVYKIEAGELKQGRLHESAELPPGDNLPLYLDELGEGFCYRSFEARQHGQSEKARTEASSELPDNAASPGLNTLNTETTQDAILPDYQSRYQAMAFTFPAGGIHCIEPLNKRVAAPIFWLCADKALTQTQLFNYHRYRPALVRHHDPWSLDVNFDALAKTIELLGGSSWLQTSNTTMITPAVFLLGLAEAELPLTRARVKQIFARQSLGHSEQALVSLRCQAAVPSYPVFIAHRQQAYYDAALFRDYWTVLKPRITEKNQHFYPELWAALPCLIAHYYAHPGDDNSLFIAAECYFTAGPLEKALAVLNKNLEINPHCQQSQYLLGKCYAQRGDKPQALACFMKQKQITPDDIEVMGWCKQFAEE